jgi:hypothetical protein
MPPQFTMAAFTVFGSQYSFFLGPQRKNWDCCAPFAFLLPRFQQELVHMDPASL